MPHTWTVLALARHIGGFYHGELLAGLVREVTAQGGRVVVAQTAPEEPELDETVVGETALSVAWDEADAVVTIALSASAAFLARMLELGKPVVLTSQRVDGVEAPVALPDNHGGIHEAVEHLRAHGHSRIGFVGDLRQYDYHERHLAYRDALTTHGLAPSDELLVVARDWSEAAGEDAARELLRRPERPDAVVTASGHNAIGLIRGLAAAGVRVPEDVAVLAFDNVEHGAYATPSLSSVHQRFDEVGALAGSLVMRALRGEHVPAGSHVAAATVVVPRGSCGCRDDVLTSRPAPASRAAVVPVQPEDLHRTLSTLLAGRHPGTVAPDATAALAVDLERLLRLGDDLTDAHVDGLLALMRGSAPGDDALHRVTSVLTEHVQRLMSTGTAAGASPHPAALSRVAAALWRLQNHGSVQRAHALADHVLEGSDVAAALLRADADAARGLGWLAQTHSRAGLLALWDDAAPGAPLRLAGVHDPDGLLDHHVGAELDWRRFPPSDLVGAADGAQGEVCLVVPVRTPARRWGLLAVLGVVNSRSSHEAYHHWATLLGSVLEGEELALSARASEARYAHAARAANDGLWELDLGTRAMYVSPRGRQLLGLDPDAPARMERWTEVTHPQDQERVRASFAQALDSPEVPVEVEYRVRRPDGTYHWLLSRGLGVATGPSGRAARLVGSLSDIHPRKELEERLRAAALYDHLTGLPNRRLFLERLTAAVEQHRRDPGSRFAVLFFDLDGFKLVNDSLGHLMGDQLLLAVAERLRTQVRAVDTAARFGGDEFAVLLSEPEPDELLAIAQRIQERISAPVELAGHEVEVTASVGVATSSGEYTDPEDVLRDADIAMYDAKGSERGSASVFDPTMHVRATVRLRARGELRTALARSEFVVHYQPVVPLDGSGLEHFEALVRWEHPERGLLLPGDFLAAMEDNATIVTLGSWVVDEVCRQVAAWSQDYPGPVAVAVNLSHREFWAPALLRTVTDSLARHGVPAHSLILEITESVIMADPAVARKVMTDLRALGVRLHIDDFGTGQSSLNALRTFPVDALKIDGAFIRELEVVEQTTELVRIIVEMGRVLGLEVVAECVETPSQADRLRSMGCANAQGWLYARALPGAEAGALLGHALGSEPVEASGTGSR
ncbi:EAL domain-containing protein [Cellulomonas sp. NPDC055163]